MQAQQPSDYSLSKIAHSLSKNDMDILMDVIIKLKNRGYGHIKPKRISYYRENDRLGLCQIYQGLCQVRDVSEANTIQCNKNYHTLNHGLIIKWEKRIHAVKSSKVEPPLIKTCSMSMDLSHEINILRELHLVQDFEKLPILIDIIDSQQSEDFVCLVLPYYPLGNVKQCLQHYGTILHSDDLILLKKALVTQIIHSIICFHQVGWLHNDIKPSNILVSHCDKLSNSIHNKQGWHIKIKLLDFALATKQTTFVTVENNLDSYNSTSYSQGGNIQLRGTPAYIASECWDLQKNQNSDYTVEKDLYALGVSVFEIFQGYKPFQVTAKSDVTSNARLQAWKQLHQGRADKKDRDIPKLDEEFKEYQSMIDGLLSIYPNNRKKVVNEYVSQFM